MKCLKRKTMSLGVFKKFLNNYFFQYFRKKKGKSKDGYFPVCLIKVYFREVLLLGIQY